jgi:hypothetical protein
MNATELRAWLGNCNSKEIARTLAQGQQGVLGAVPSGTSSYYFKVEVKGVHKKTFGFACGSPYKIEITGNPQATDGWFLPDLQNQCTRLDASNSPGIVMSGWFTGCTFARCVGNQNHLWIGHIYVDSHLPNNNPTLQARNFETDCGAPANSATGFKTHGLLDRDRNEARSLIIGTYVGASWDWHFVILDGNNHVKSARRLDNNDFVAL